MAIFLLILLLVLFICDWLFNEAAVSKAFGKLIGLILDKLKVLFSKKQ
jgi:hypothetical protein